MSRYSKRISEKIEKSKKPSTPSPAKPGRDIVLIILICINFIFLMIGWSQLAILDRVIYILLEGALLSIYAQRHAKLSEKYTDWVKYFSFVCMGFAFLLFIYSCYLRYIAA